MLSWRKKFWAPRRNIILLFFWVQNQGLNDQQPCNQIIIKTYQKIGARIYFAHNFFVQSICRVLCHIKPVVIFIFLVIFVSRCFLSYCVEFRVDEGYLEIVVLCGRQNFQNKADSVRIQNYKCRLNFFLLKWFLTYVSRMNVFGDNQFWLNYLFFIPLEVFIPLDINRLHWKVIL